jgi:hypothetical protein
LGINLGDVIVEGDDIYGDGVKNRRTHRSPGQSRRVFVSNTFMITSATDCPLV